jgi:hypothetical protein
MTSPATLNTIGGRAADLGGSFGAWVGLLAEEAALRLPHFVSLGWPVETRDCYLIKARRGPFLRSVDEFLLQGGRNGADVMAADYDVEAKLGASGRRYEQSDTAIFTTSDVEIVSLGEFPNTAPVAENFLRNGFGTLAASAGALGGEAIHKGQNA